MLAGDPDYRHEIVYSSDEAVAFLNRYPTLYGYALVAPREHVTEVTGSFSRSSFLGLMELVYDVSEALRAVLPVDRVYLASLGANEGNAHVHWHVAPLPPGVPYDRQQFRALMAEDGVLDVPPGEQAALADRIRAELANRRT